VPTDKSKPPSTSRRVDELKQFLMPTGISAEQANRVLALMEAMLLAFTRIDGRDRRFITLVLTREDDGPTPMVSTDLIANVDREIALASMSDWLDRFEADG
jgi:hypothetical protein